MICYGLAVKLGRDIDDVMSWPYAKIHDWLAYLTWADRRENKS